MSIGSFASNFFHTALPFYLTSESLKVKIDCESFLGTLSVTQFVYLSLCVFVKP
ncbi:MAG TPA: hypothetical protein PKC66_16995 [Leptospiraceae bacterium]|nr:hypothetical protein [Leptospiraceae bacterium]